MGKKKKLIPVGVGYYKKEQWEILKSLVSDPEIIEDTYDEWLQILKDSVIKLEKTGIAPIPIEVDVLEMNSWCIKKNIPFDGSARAQYITEKTNEFLQKQQNNTDVNRGRC
ncbi:MAG: hypothetical protein K9M56_08665 [Victivallales bacterium]|nr:hypothetical protein [Victivallales bacterium]